MLSPRRAVSRSLAELPGEVSGVGRVMLAAPACGTGGLLPSPYRWHGVPSHPALSPIGDKPQTPFELGRRGNNHRMPAERGTLQFDADLRPAKVRHRDDHTWTVHEVLCEWKHPGTGTRTDGSARGGALLAAARVRPTADCPAPDAESRSPGGSCTLAALGNPGASNARAAFAASPQEHSLKPTLARWPRPREQARASDQAR